MIRTRRRTIWKQSAKLIFLGAVLASLAVHLPVYSVLGALADVFRSESKSRPKPAVEIDFNATGPLAKTEPQKDTPKHEKEKPPEPPKKEPSPLEKKAEVKPKEVPVVAATPPKPVEVPKASLQAIKQKSANPNVETPKDPKFIAKENQRVEEETVARLRSYNKNDESPEMGGPQENTPQPQDKNLPGNDDNDKTGDTQDRSGPEHGKEQPKMAVTPDSPRGAAPPRANGPVAPPQPSNLPPDQIIRDKFGTFVIPGAAIAKRREMQARRSLGLPTGPTTDNRSISWSTFEHAIGSDQLRDDREIYAEARAMHRSRIRGSHSRAKWKEFRAAIENFVPSVKPGNQTALNAAASPFADYLTEVHIAIHQEFADRFLPSLPVGTGPLTDSSLVTKLEIILNRDGTIHRIGIVESSGIMQYDYGAYASVVNGAPYPTPPDSILSGDGRVYFHWGFYRNERQCGTFNAEAFILPHPPQTPQDKSFQQEPILPRGVKPARPLGEPVGMHGRAPGHLG